MKKILAVIGSPRKNGNTHILVNKIIDGAKDKGAQAELLFLGDLNINECDGCHVCWKGKPCCKQDAMNPIYQKIIDSDVIIFGTPVYWYGPTALMKGFIDRFVYFNCRENRAKIAGKSAVLAIPFEEDNLETASGVVTFFEKSLEYLQMNLVDKIIVGGVSRKGDILKKRKELETAFQLGRIIAQ